jgi:hypothetical protein
VKTNLFVTKFDFEMKKKGVSDERFSENIKEHYRYLLVLDAFNTVQACSSQQYSCTNDSDYLEAKFCYKIKQKKPVCHKIKKIKGRLAF